jgi:hypothetical protein
MTETAADSPTSTQTEGRRVIDTSLRGAPALRRARSTMIGGYRSVIGIGDGRRPT